MSTKILIKLSVALLLLLGVWQGGLWWQKRQDQIATSWEIFTSEAQAEQVDKIVLKEGELTLELGKQENQWQVGESPADSNKVNELLGLLRSPMVEIVGQNPDRFVDLGIGDDKAKRIAFWQGESEKLVILLAESNQALIRKSDQQNVYRLPKPVTFSTSEDFWKAPEPTAAPETIDENQTPVEAEE